MIGEITQTGDLDQIIGKVPEMTSHLSEYFELAAGDTIVAGTPSGVGPFVKGDVMDVEIERVGTF